MSTLHDPSACDQCQSLSAAVRNGEVVCVHGFGANGRCELCLNTSGEWPVPVSFADYETTRFCATCGARLDARWPERRCPSRKPDHTWVVCRERSH